MIYKREEKSLLDIILLMNQEPFVGGKEEAVVVLDLVPILFVKISVVD